MVSVSLKPVFALAENYPDLKASENFLNLQKELITRNHNRHSPHNILAGIRLVCLKKSMGFYHASISEHERILKVLRTG